MGSAPFVERVLKALLDYGLKRKRPLSENLKAQ
jgi:hypothetical protein